MPSRDAFICQRLQIKQNIKTRKRINIEKRVLKIRVRKNKNLKCKLASIKKSQQVLFGKVLLWKTRCLSSLFRMHIEVWTIFYDILRNYFDKNSTEKYQGCCNYKNEIIYIISPNTSNPAEYKLWSNWYFKENNKFKIIQSNLSNSSELINGIYSQKLGFKSYRIYSRCLQSYPLFRGY